MENKKEINKSIIDKEDIMSYKKSERQRKERDRLIIGLNDDWGRANDKEYKIEYRKYKLIHMISDITYYIEKQRGLLSNNDRYALLSLIRAICYVTAKKSPANKIAVRELLKELETLSK